MLSAPFRPGRSTILIFALFVLIAVALLEPPVSNSNSGIAVSASGDTGIVSQRPAKDEVRGDGLVAIKPDASRILAYYAFETDGSDSHTGGNDLTEYNSPVYVSGKVGNGVDIEWDDGQYFSIPSPHSGQVGANDFTIFFWTKAEEFRKKPIYSYIYRCGSSVYDGGVVLRFAQETTQEPNARLAVGLYGDDGDPGSVLTLHSGVAAHIAEPDTWYAFAVVHDVSEKRLTIYDNTSGPFEQSATNTYAFTTASATNSFGLVAKSGPHFYDGIIDELSIWDAALSLDELEWLWNSGFGQSYADIISDTLTATPTGTPTEAAPTDTPTPTATNTPTSTLTSTSTPTATPTGTSTATPTQTPTSAPDSPTLLLPSNGMTTDDGTPTFAWDSVSGAIQYHLQVDNNSDFSSPVLDVSPIASSYTPLGSMADDIYYWRVLAIAGAGNWSDWSVTWTVTIKTIYPVYLPLTMKTP